MTDKLPVGWQIPAINPLAPYVQESFDLNRMDAFVKSLGSTFYHWKATPSPIGLSDRGDYRRNQGVDVMTSNGYIYTLGGKFTATMTSNQKDQVRPSEGGLIDSATAYLTLPRFYDDASDLPADQNNTPSTPSADCCGTNDSGNGVVQGKRIRLTPGDRLYSDPTIDDLVVNKELITFSYNSANVPMYPIVQMDGPVVDSRGIFYNQNADFNIDCNGNIAWIDGRPNPGIDSDTGEGRTYSIRYLYRAFYYVSSIIKEVRITEVTENGIRRPERMPMFVQIQREYLYRNINNGDELNKPANQAVANRQTPEVPESININQPPVLVETIDLDTLE